MPRWQPDTRERLVSAALDLYAEQGYDRTTVTEIADRAGVTSRTYFRYFPDKREVLFVNSQLVNEAIVEALREALKSERPYDAVLTGLVAAEKGFGTREFGTRREAVVAESEELRERDAVKLVMHSEAIAKVLREAGLDEVSARITADLGIVVLIGAIRKWYVDEETPWEKLVELAAEQVRQTMLQG